jgi:hypothetical protein
MDTRTFVTNRSAYNEWTGKLREIAQRLIWQYASGGPPYDPFVFAARIGVDVALEPVSGLDGYIEVVGDRYFAVISSLANRRRQRFTLSHELGHVVFMRQAAKGTKVPLVRYRATGCPPALHQDPIEESLCNFFASELLLPTAEVKDEVISTNDPINCVLKMADSFDVSLQAAAKRLVTILGKKRTGCALWRNGDGRLWPMPIWSEGLTSNCRSHLLRIEELISGFSEKKVPISCTLDSYGPNRGQAEICIRPLGKSFSLVFASDPGRQQRASERGVPQRHVYNRRPQTSQWGLFG